MRVASTQLVSGYIKQLNNTYENQTQLMEQSDGSKLHRPSDDSVGYSKFLRYKNSITENVQYQANVKNAISWMKNTDAALVDVCDCISTIVEKTNNAATSTNNEADMKAISMEMMVMVQQSVADANVQIDGRYLMSGQSDLIQPFSMSNELKDCGVAKTLDDNQKLFFNSAADVALKSDSVGDLAQMLTLKGDDGSIYYLNTKNGYVYTQDFMVKGYKDEMAAGNQSVAEGNECAKISVYNAKIGGVETPVTVTGSVTLSDKDDISFFGTTALLKINDGVNDYYLNSKTGKVYEYNASPTTFRSLTESGTAENKFVSENFKNTGEIYEGTETEHAGKGFLWIGEDKKDPASGLKFSFDTIKQYVVTYNGDEKYISMVKQNGEIQPSSDTVNVTGFDSFGANIFDDASSGNVRSGTSALNDLLTIVAKTEACDHHWLGQNGITTANNAFNTVLASESKLASRQQVYTAMQTMLTTQNVTITGDISGVADTDVSKLAVDLMTAQLVYNMSLSVGSKILPGSLADYL